MKTYILPDSTSARPYDNENKHIRTFGRLHAEEAAIILGFQPFDIPVLVHNKLLKPLGNPIQNSVKYFAAVHILSMARDPEWLDKATKVVSRHWQEKNERKRTKHLVGKSVTSPNQPL